jgi:flavin reductase (DIM6/NTAB) family NADH-FMN oxidoreductase RutF
MSLLKKILNKFNGLLYSQEYLCVSKESFQQPLQAYLVDDMRVRKNITNHHSFTGYCPVIFTFYSLVDPDLLSLLTIKIVFTQKTLQPNEILRDKDAIAELTLKKIHQQTVDNDTVFYYEAIHGKHRMLSVFHQFIIGVNNRLYNKKPGNVFLSGNLYKQVQIAYSLPRTISLITVGQNDRFNLFPTDLHGPAGKYHYIISLRYEGRACRQVEAARQVTVSQVNADSYKAVYALGKNHMQQLKTREHFGFGPLLSKKFQLPLPASTLSYRELVLEDSFRHGIHQLMLFKVLSQETLTDTRATLAHIHTCYATWRDNKHLEGNYLLR